MAASLTLEQARIQLNMPFASVSEVMIAAKNAGIEINFTGIQNTADASVLNQNTGFSVFGGNNPLTSQSQQAPTQKSFIQPQTSSQSSSSSALNFGKGNQSYNFNTPKLSDGASVWGNKGLGGTFGGSKKDAFKLDTPSLSNPAGTTNQFGLGGKVGDISLDNFLFTSMKDFKVIQKSDITYTDNNQDVDLSKVKSQEFLDGGKMRFTMDDGSVVEKQLSEQTLKLAGGTRQYSKIEYVDGKAIYYDLDGNKVDDKTRDVRFGEPGFVPDGNSISQDLTAVLGEKTLSKYAEKQNGYAGQLSNIEASLATLTDDYIAKVEAENPQQAKELKKQRDSLTKDKTKIGNKIFKEKEKLAAQYIKQVYKECDGDIEKIKTKIDSLIRNSDMSSATAQQMVHILRSFQEKTNGMSKDEIANLFEQAMDSALLNGDENTTAMAGEITRMDGKAGKDMLDGYSTAAQRTGRQAVATQALINGVENTVDPETGEVRAEMATNIGRAVTDLAGDDGAVALAEKVKENESDDLKISVNQAIDEQAARSGNEDVIEASLDVTTSIRDAKKQVQANENTHQTYEQMGATDETKKKRAEAVGSRIGDFHEDAQLDVDSTEREYDIEDVYLIAASQSIQNVNARVQKEMIERTIASGNEQAMNNIAEHAYDYDISNRDDIIKMIKEKGTDETLKILEEAKNKYDQQAENAKTQADAQRAINETKPESKPETTQSTQTTAQNQTKTKQQSQVVDNRPKQQVTGSELRDTQPRTSSLGLNLSISPRATIGTVREMFKSSTTMQVIQSEEFRSLSPKESAEIVRNLNASDKKEAIKTIVERLEGFELQGYMHSNMKNDILKYLVSNPTMKNQEKLNFVKRFLTGDDKRFIEKIREQMPINASTSTQGAERKPFNFEV